jgi:transposase-like protein
MAEHIRVGARPTDGRTGSLGELIHATIRRTIEVARHAELAAALGAARYARCAGRCGYRTGSRFRTLTGPTGPVPLTLPRATLFTPTGPREWTSTLLPRYQRRFREVNEAVAPPTWPAGTPDGSAAP